MNELFPEYEIDDILNMEKIMKTMSHELRIAVKIIETAKDLKQEGGFEWNDCLEVARTAHLIHALAQLDCDSDQIAKAIGEIGVNV